MSFDPGGLSDLQVADELVRRRAEIDRLEAEFAQIAWVGHQRGIGAAGGSPSTPAWLRRHTGMREGEARGAIEAGHVGELLPKVGAAWRDGQITGGAAKTIAGARVEGHDLKFRALEDLFLDLALANDMRELQRACTHFRNCARADGTCPREHDGVTISDTYNGTRIVHAELSSTAAEIVSTAIHAFTDPPSDRDTRTPARRRADGLVKMAEAALAALHASPDGPKRAIPACSIVIDWTTLTGETWGRIDGEYTGTLHQTDVERLLCDCTVSRVVHHPTADPTSPGRPRPRLQIPRMHPTPRMDPSPPRHPLERRRPHCPRQPRIALRPPPSRRAPPRLDREVRRPHLHRLPTRRHRSHVATRADL